MAWLASKLGRMSPLQYVRENRLWDKEPVLRGTCGTGLRLLCLLHLLHHPGSCGYNAGGGQDGHELKGLGENWRDKTSDLMFAVPGQ